MTIWIAPLFAMLMQQVSVQQDFAVRYEISPVLAGQILQAADRYEIPRNLAFAVVKIESNFNPRALGKAGERGLMQLMPSTARWLDKTVTLQQLYSPQVNLNLGFKYLRYLMNRYPTQSMALAAYNRGPGYVDKAPEWQYVRVVLASQNP